MSKTEDIPEMNQVELHPFLQQDSLLDFSKKNNIHLTAYSPLGSGDRIKEMKAENEPSLLEEPVIKKIAEKHSATPGQILISWSVERGTAVIPKSTSKGHIISNLESEKIHLDSQDMEEITKLDRHFRYVTGEFFVTKGNPYENIYDE